MFIGLLELAIYFFPVVFNEDAVYFFTQERHDALEQMGVSVEKSGIKVETGKYFLVNLNADPSLNELLVYYLKVSSIPGQSECWPLAQWITGVLS